MKIRYVAMPVMSAALILALSGCGGGGGGTGPTLPRHSQPAEEVAPGAKRTLLHKKTLEEFPGKELILSYVEYAPGAMSGRHFHSGPELVYIMSGSVKIEKDGEPPQELKAGETLFNKAKVVHNVKNESKTEAATFISYLINDEGALLATPVK